jgi:hypothetical protein
MDIDKTKARIEGRKEAEAFLALCAENGEAFMEGVRAAFHATIPKQPEARMTMNDDEAKRFEATHIGFGQHQGCKYGDVPIDYLTWIADKAIDLQAYLRSDRGKSRIEKDI